MKAIKYEGVISIIGFIGGLEPRGNPTILDALSHICTIRGVYVGPRSMMQDMITAIEANDIHPVVDKKVFDLGHAREAYEYMVSCALKHFAMPIEIIKTFSEGKLILFIF
jgi:D-arabinose 1-dehydrogenase-like Zn-dependent alcohol dehydrogenase